MDSWLIRDVNALNGTVYFEFLRGRYQDTCWQPGSVFLDEDSFGYIERYFQKHLPSYDHYSFVQVNGSLWRDILSDLRSLVDFLGTDPSAPELSHRISYFSLEAESNFFSDRSGNVARLRTTVRELCDWVEENLPEYEMISVLGI